MASLSAKFLLVTVLVHLSIILLAVHAEEEDEVRDVLEHLILYSSTFKNGSHWTVWFCIQELTTNPESLPSVLLLQYDAEEELEARGAKKFFRKVFRCKKVRD